MKKTKRKVSAWDARKISLRREERNERTSKRVAAIAGRIAGLNVAHGYRETFYVRCTNGIYAAIEWSDVLALAASCLTQSPNKPKPRTVRERR